MAVYFSRTMNLHQAGSFRSRLRVARLLQAERTTSEDSPCLKLQSYWQPPV